jgi:hypothetical protein
MLRRDMERYVALHEAGGFKFSNPRVLLRSFVTFAEAEGDEYVKVDRPLEWATRAPSAPQRRRRLDTVRQFAQEMRVEGGIVAGGWVVRLQGPGQAPSVLGEPRRAWIRLAEHREGARTRLVVPACDL